LTGGVDFNWFVLLFVQLTLLTPFLFAISKKRGLSIILLVIGLILTVIFFFIHPSYQSFKWTMIFGWSFVYFLGMVISKYELKKDISLKKYGFFALFFALIFLILDSRFFNIKNLVLTEHKYPPDIVYLSYGLTITFILLIIGKKLIANPFNPSIIFLSRHSYSIFFANYLALDMILNISGKINLLRSILLQLIFVLALTLFFNYLLNLILAKKKYFI
jgi:peptidoglycan/LPS O-acetylase OafA/YrhL